MRTIEKVLFSLLSKTSFGEDVIYNKMYENISREIQKAYGSLVPGEADDFPIMVPTEDYGMYLHIPFCDTFCNKCPYDKVTNLQLIDKYCKAVITEMEIIRSQKWDKDVRPTGIFIGGGTPSILPLENMSVLVKNMKDIFIKDADPEITMELNPKSSSIEKLDKWIDMGINRFSLGVQSFNNNVLKFYNRKHGAEISEELCRYLTKIGFNYNIDILFGFDGHLQKDFIDDILKAIDIGVPHISLYPYFEGEITKQKYKQQKSMYEAARNYLLSNGYYQYSIFDFCRMNGRKSEYWSTFTYKDNMGLGAGASGGSREKGSYTKYSDIDIYCSSIEHGMPAFFRNKEKEPARINILNLYDLSIDRNICNNLFGVDPYIDQKELFDILKAVGHIKIDKDNIHLKNLYRQVFLFTLCFFIDMKEPLRQKIKEMKTLK